MSKVCKQGGVAATVLLIMLCACTSAPKPAPAPPAPAAPQLDASYDWHGLLLLPFGSVLKDAPFTLHEVLMFRDTEHAAQADDAECYAMDQPPPRFLARTPNEYLLCFKHDHLARVEATVNVPLQEAAQVFGDACGLWHRKAAPESGPPGGCEGRDGAVGYSGRLEENAQQTDRALTIRLDTLAQP